MKNNKKTSEKNSKNQFEKLVKISILIGICVVTGFIIYYGLTPEPGYVYFGVLEDGEELENYSIDAKLGEPVNFSVIVGNYLNRDYQFRVKVLKGDNNTILYPGPSNGTLEYTFENTTITHKNTWISNIINVSFSEVGANQLIIIELWEIISEMEYFFDILWLRLNITIS